MIQPDVVASLRRRIAASALSLFWLFTSVACSRVVDSRVIVGATPTCQPTSAWTNFFQLASAGLSNPPALAITPEQVTFAYITSDQNGARQVMRRLRDGRFTENVLTLPPIQPRAQTVFPAANGTIYLLWIDLDETTRQPALFAALILPTDEIARGPLMLSRDRERVYDYAAALGADGALWVTWSGAVSNEAAVSMRQLDAEGRPAPSTLIASDALHPTLIARADGTFWLFYEQARGDGVMRALVSDGVTLESDRILGKVARTPGTLIHSVFAASDETHGYLFWNMTRDDGRRETWFSTGELNAANWSQPSLFEPPYVWVRPAAGLQGALRAAVTLGDEIGIAALDGGVFTGFAPVTSCTPVLEPPALFIAGAQHYLVWSQPQRSAPATLFVTTLP
jgi:hypothetical protein